MAIGLQIGKLLEGRRTPPPRPCKILKSPACLGLSNENADIARVFYILKDYDHIQSFHLQKYYDHHITLVTS